MDQLAPQTRRTIVQYWSALLGCAPDHFGTARTLIVAHTGLGDYLGIYCFRHRQSLLISTPPAQLAQVIAAAQQVTIADLGDPARVAILGGGAVEQVIGPAILTYADTATFRPVAHRPARLLVAGDALAIDHLRAACGTLEWEHGGSESSDTRAGAFADGTLAALAGYRVWGGTLAHLAIVTHPRYRRQGFGTAAVSLLGAEALKCGLILQYRTLRHNAASLGVASALGFVPWATTVALRLYSNSDTNPP